MAKKSIHGFDEIGLLAGGIFFFALYAHYHDWKLLLSVSGMLCAALGISRYVLVHTSSVIETLGLTSISKKVMIYILCGCAAGITLGMIYRDFRGDTLVPGRLNRFFPVACLIGAAEELIYRGFIQGESRKTGFIGAIFLASVSHVAYKCAIFSAAPVPGGDGLHLLAVATFLGGLLLGGLREFSGNLLPPVTVHVLFDLIVYGGYSRAPWWVWS